MQCQYMNRLPQIDPFSILSQLSTSISHPQRAFLECCWVLIFEPCVGVSEEVAEGYDKAARGVDSPAGECVGFDNFGGFL